MSKCKPPRDLSFRAYVESLPIVHKDDREWKEDLKQRKGEAKGKGKAGGNTQPDSKGKGKGKDQQKGSRDRAQPTNRWTTTSKASSSTGAWTAAAWSAGNNWWSASGNAVTKSTKEIAVKNFVPVDNMFYLKVGVVIGMLLLMFIGLWQVIKVARKCTTCKCCKRKRNAVVHQVSRRTVGVQSQCNYTGTRYLADTQGFRRAGEVTVEMVYDEDLHLD